MRVDLRWQIFCRKAWKACGHGDSLERKEGEGKVQHRFQAQNGFLRDRNERNAERGQQKTYFPGPFVTPACCVMTQGKNYVWKTLNFFIGVQNRPLNRFLRGSEFPSRVPRCYATILLRSSTCEWRKPLTKLSKITARRRFRFDNNKTWRFRCYGNDKCSKSTATEEQGVYLDQQTSFMNNRQPLWTDTHGIYACHSISWSTYHNSALSWQLVKMLASIIQRGHSQTSILSCKQRKKIVDNFVQRRYF